MHILTIYFTEIFKSNF